MSSSRMDGAEFVFGATVGDTVSIATDTASSGVVLVGPGQTVVE